MEVNAAEINLVGALDSSAADAHARQGEERVAGLVGLVGWGDVADHVRELLDLGIDARRADIDDDAGQVGRVDLDARHVVPGQEVAQHDRDETVTVVGLAHDPRARRWIERHNAGETVQREQKVGGLLRKQERPPVELVAGEHLAEPVHDPAAWRREQPRADPVVVGHRPIFGAVADLKIVEAHPEAAEGGRLGCHHQQRAPGEDATACVVRLDGLPEEKSPSWPLHGAALRHARVRRCRHAV